MTKSNIYDQHRAAFSNVSAYVLMKDGERIATIAFKFPKDGAGRLWCYFHFIGTEMSRGYAGGYGYDKRSAAVQDAIGKLAPYRNEYAHKGERWAIDDEQSKNAQIERFRAMFKDIGGKDWTDVLRDNNIQVFKAV